MNSYLNEVAFGRREQYPAKFSYSQGYKWCKWVCSAVTSPPTYHSEVLLASSLELQGFNDENNWKRDITDTSPNPGGWKANGMATEFEIPHRNGKINNVRYPPKCLTILTKSATYQINNVFSNKLQMSQVPNPV